MSTSFLYPSPYPAVVPLLRPHAPGVEAFGLTDRGLLRPSNEDAYAVAADLGLYVVADGVGGNAAGEVASRLAVDSIIAFFRDIALNGPAAADAPEAAWQASFAASLLVRAVEEANAVVWSAAVANAAMTGMATTVTALLLRHDHAVVAQVGDSRAYLWRGRRLRQLTEDHTAIAAYMQAGLLTREDAATSPLRGVLARAVGCDQQVEVDTRLLAVEPGDTFLVCSDGVHDVLADDVLAGVLLRERDLTRAAARLVELANEAGGPDNVTAVLARVP
jgi:protein phosphatase